MLRSSRRAHTGPAHAIRRSAGAWSALALAAGGLAACTDDDSAGPDAGVTVDDLERLESRIARIEEDFGMFSDQLDSTATTDDPGDISDDITQDIDGEPDLLGQTVTISGEVTTVIGPSSFVIAGDNELDPTDADSPLPTAGIVIVAADPPAVSRGDVIQAVGVVSQFDEARFEGELGIDLDDALHDVFEGEVALRAQSVSTDVPRDD